MSDRAKYAPGPASGARIQKDGEKWTLVLARELGQRGCHLDAGGGGHCRVVAHDAVLRVRATEKNRRKNPRADE